jgi:glycosyltransferase involved in cell wall biosynthesis
MIESILKELSEKHCIAEGCHERVQGTVSICIPNYNKGEWVANCISSALSQTTRTMEIIIVDDCSTDLSHEQIMEAIEGQTNVIYHRLPKRCGTAWAQNIAYYLSSGQYIANMDSDDYSHRTRIVMQLDYMRTHNLDMVGSSAYRIDEDYAYRKLEYIKEDPLSEYLDRGECPVCFGSLLFKAEILDNLGGLNKKFIGTEDYEFIMFWISYW